jgi:alcohol dehydrogenase
LNHVVDFNYESVPKRYDRIAVAMGIDPSGLSREKRKQSLLNAIVALQERSGIRTTISEMGVTQEDIPRLSINAFNDPCSATNPRLASVQTIERIYEKAL